MLRSILPAITLSILVSLPALGGDAHPLSNAKVGDTVTYTTKTTNGVFDTLGGITYTVIAKDKNEVAVKTTGWIKQDMGAGDLDRRDIPEKPLKYDLTKSLNPFRFANLYLITSPKATKGKEGTEKIKVGGKEYDCKYVNYSAEAKSEGKDFKAQIKLWISKDTPLGVVKVVRIGGPDDPKEKMTMELKEVKAKK